MNPETKEIAESFGCPYTLFEEGSDSMQVEWAWQVALRSGKKKGFCPAILVPDRYADEWLAEGGRKEPERERILAACGDNGREILMGTSEPNGRTGLDDVLEMLDLIGEETRGDALHHFSGFRGEYMDSRATAAEIISAAVAFHRSVCYDNHDIFGRTFRPDFPSDNVIRFPSAWPPVCAGWDPGSSCGFVRISA